jgi:hypothetical protein
MSLRPVYIQGELIAFIPTINPNVTAGVPHHHAPEAVASRPDHVPLGDPAGTHHPCQREL